MLDPVWSLVIASALAVIGGVISYKQFIFQLEDSSSGEDFLTRRNRGFTRFIRKFFIVEAVPFLLLMYSILQVFSETGVSTDPALPLVAVLLIVFFGLLSLYFTTSQILRDSRASAGMKQIMTHAMVIVHSIPWVSIILLFMLIVGMV